MSTRLDSYVMMGIAVGVTAMFCLLFLGPQQRELSVLLASTRTMKQQLARREAAIAELSTLKDNALGAKDLLTTYRTCIRPTAEVGGFIEEVSAIAERLGLSDRRIVPLTPARRGPVTVLPIRISFESGFNASFAFVREVERLRRAARVTELNLERVAPGERPTGDGANVLRTELALQIYYEAT